MTVPCCPGDAPCPSHRESRALRAARVFIGRADPLPDVLPAQVIRMFCELRHHALVLLEIADRRQATTEALARTAVDCLDLAAAADALTGIRAVLAELDGCDGWERHELEFVLARIAQLVGQPGRCGVS